MKSYIHFIRHGVTEGNAKRWFYGWADVALLPEGIEALQKLRDEGVHPPLGDADLYTSGMLRTEQTLQTIYGNVPHRKIDNMKEMNFGQWECRTWEELKDVPNIIDRLGNMESDDPYPDGESPLGFRRRVVCGLEELRGYHRLKELSHRHSGQDAVSIMVCHGGVISSCMSHLFPESTENFWQWIPDPGHGYTVYFEEGEPVRYEKF